MKNVTLMVFLVLSFGACSPKAPYESANAADAMTTEAVAGAEEAADASMDAMGPSQAEMDLANAQKEAAEAQLALAQETARLQAEEERKISQLRLCAPLDDEQTAINQSWYSLKRDYPFTSDFFMDCIKKSNSDDNFSQCSALACGMASMGASNESEGCGNFGQRIITISKRSSDLGDIRRRLEYSDCPQNVLAAVN